MRTQWPLLLAVITVSSLDAGATECPGPARAALAKAYPSARLSGCKSETENGVAYTSVSGTVEGGLKVEVDVATDGHVLKREEQIPVSAVPREVLEGLARKYPGAKAEGAERHLLAEGTVRYEVVCRVGAAKKELTFNAQGGFLGEE